MEKLSVRILVLHKPPAADRRAGRAPQAGVRVDQEKGVRVREEEALEVGPPLLALLRRVFVARRMAHGDSALQGRGDNPGDQHSRIGVHHCTSCLRHPVLLAPAAGIHSSQIHPQFASPIASIRARRDDEEVLGIFHTDI